MKRRVVFPLFNVLVVALLGGLIGYYMFRPLAGFLLGGLVGLAPALVLEYGLGRLGMDNWLYKRRVLLLVVLEVPLFVFVVGPYVYAVAETRPDPHPVCCETPLDYGAEAFEDLTIRSADGILIKGWYVPPQETPGAVVVLLHGARGDRRGTAWHAGRLIEAGYGVVMYDQRALGESTGERVSFGWLDPPDLLAITDHLAGRPEVDPQRIGVVGLSGGAHIALNTAHIDPARFAALWLDGLEAQRIEDFPTAENLGERFATLINGQILTMMEFHLGREAPPPFSEILVSLQEPRITLIAGGLTDFEVRVHRIYARIAPENVSTWVIDEAWHLGGPQAAPDEYSRRMLAFFDEILGASQ